MTKFARGGTAACIAIAAALLSGCSLLPETDVQDPSNVEDYMGGSTEQYPSIQDRAPLEDVQASSDEMIVRIRDALTAQFPELEWTEKVEGRLAGVAPEDDIYRDDYDIGARSYGTARWIAPVTLATYSDADVDTALALVSDIGNEYGYGDLSTIQRLSGDDGAFGTVAENTDGDKYYFTSVNGVVLQGRANGHLTTDQLTEVATLPVPTP